MDISGNVGAIEEMGFLFFHFAFIVYWPIEVKKMFTVSSIAPTCPETPMPVLTKTKADASGIRPEMLEKRWKGRKCTSCGSSIAPQFTWHLGSLFSFENDWNDDRDDDDVGARTHTHTHTPLNKNLSAYATRCCSLNSNNVSALCVWQWFLFVSSKLVSARVVVDYFTNFCTQPSPVFDVIACTLRCLCSVYSLLQDAGSVISSTLVI